MAICNNNNTTYAGMVLYVGYETVQVMSDVWEQWKYALVLDVCTGEYKRVYDEGANWSAEVDAEPIVKEMYERYLEADNRHNKAVTMWNRHNTNIEHAHLLRITVKELVKLKNTYGGKLYDGCWDLLKTKKFRNTFRESLANQLRTWLSETNNKYKLPFSPKQETYVMPYSRW